jgi:hypothetical protein
MHQTIVIGQGIIQSEPARLLRTSVLKIASVNAARLLHQFLYQTEVRLVKPFLVTRRLYSRVHRLPLPATLKYIERITRLIVREFHFSARVFPCWRQQYRSHGSLVTQDFKTQPL